MHEYDVTLKMLLRGSARMAFKALTGGAVEKWLDVELPRVQNPRMDLLGEMADGGLLHLELQSGNDAEMPERMAGYALGIYRRFRRLPRQIVLYVGERALGMEPELAGPRFAFSYELRDMRDLDGDTLLDSTDPGDNVLAVLGRLRDSKAAVAEIVRRVKGEGGKPRMPLGGELSEDKIAALEQWVKEGAHWPSAATVSAGNRSAATGKDASAAAASPGGTTMRGRSPCCPKPYRARAQAAPGVSAPATRAVKPLRARRSRRSASIAASPPWR